MPKLRDLLKQAYEAQKGPVNRWAHEQEAKVEHWLASEKEKIALKHTAKQQEAEAKAQQEAEVKAQQEAEARAQQEAVVKAQREAEVKALLEAQAKDLQALRAQQEAQAKALEAQREAEVKTLLEAQSKALQALQEAEPGARLEEQADLHAQMAFDEQDLPAGPKHALLCPAAQADNHAGSGVIAPPGGFASEAVVMVGISPVEQS